LVTLGGILLQHIAADGPARYPVQGFYGRDPPALLSYEQGQSRVPAVDKQLVARDEFLVEIKERLLHAQEVMKGNYDAHHRQVEFQVGDWVWLHLHHLIAATLTGKAKGKLAPKFYGPFKVLERIDALVYHLELPPQSRIHNVFHVVFLKKFNVAPPATPATLSPIKHGRILPEPEKVLRTRFNHDVWKIMVKWVGQAAANATWEQVLEFNEAFPSFQLEDELFHNGGGGEVLWMPSLASNISAGQSRQL
jgi:hypothetical protein